MQLWSKSIIYNWVNLSLHWCENSALWLPQWFRDNTQPWHCPRFVERDGWPGLDIGRIVVNPFPFLEHNTVLGFWSGGMLFHHTRMRCWFLNRTGKFKVPQKASARGILTRTRRRGAGNGKVMQVFKMFPAQCCRLMQYKWLWKGTQKHLFGCLFEMILNYMSVWPIYLIVGFSMGVRHYCL